MDNTTISKQFLNRFWNLSNELRGFGSVDESYILILFLLVLRKERVVESFHLSKQQLLLVAEEELQKRKDLNERADIFKAFQMVFKPKIESSQDSIMEKILSFISSLEVDSSNIDFPEFFESILRLFHGSVVGKSLGDNMLPQELVDFMVFISDIKPDDKIYNPFAGMASFGIAKNSECIYLGQERNIDFWALGVLRILAHSIKGAKYLCEDSITNWDTNQNFDLIITAPPFGRIREGSERFKGYSYEQFIIENSLNSLNSTGKLILLVPERFLFSGGREMHFRRELVHQDLVEKIISLPPGILGRASFTKTSIVVLTKRKVVPEQTTIIDASQLIGGDFRKEEFNYAPLYNCFKSDDKSKFLLKISNKDIVEEKFNFELSRYFLKPESFDIENGVSIGELLMPVKGYRDFVDDGFKYVSIKHLQKDNLDFKLKVEEIEDKTTPLKYSRLIEESCLLFAKIGNDLKPTYFEYNGEPIVVSNNVFSYRLGGDRIDLNYLINEFYSDYVTTQLEGFRRGTAQQVISKNDFERIIISLPSLNEQRVKINAIKEAFIRSEEIELQLKKEVLGLKTDASREFASIRHTMRQYLNALKSNVSGTRKYIERSNGPITLDSIYSKNLKRTLGEHLNSLEGTIDSMSKLLIEDKLSDSEGAFMHPHELIIEAQNRFKDPQSFKFEELSIDYEVFVSDTGYFKPLIKISKEAFYRIFSNVVVNAKEHGFKDRKGNIIRTILTINQQTGECLIIISNNGKPLPDGFGMKELVTRGEKTSDSKGTGFGGADIKDILSKFNADFEIETDNKTFPVSYVLSFPLFYKKESGEIIQNSL